MFEWFQPGSSVDTVMEWRWATAHPFLFTIIKSSHVYLIATLMYVGAKVIKRGNK